MSDRIPTHHLSSLLNTEAHPVIQQLGTNAKIALRYLVTDPDHQRASERARKDGYILAADVLLKVAYAKDRTAAVGDLVLTMQQVQTLCAETDVLAMFQHDTTAFTNALGSIAWAVEFNQDMVEQFNAMKNESGSFNSASIIQMVLYYVFSVNADVAAKMCTEFARKNSLELPVQFQRIFPTEIRYGTIPSAPEAATGFAPFSFSNMDGMFTKGIPFQSAAPPPTPFQEIHTPFPPIPSAPAKEVVPAAESVDNMLTHIADLRQILPMLEGKERDPVVNEIRSLEAVIEQALASDEKKTQTLWQPQPQYAPVDSSVYESDEFLAAQIHAVYGP